MSARGAVENVLARYAWAYDLDELELLHDCFTADAEVEFGNGLQRGREAVLAELARRRAVYRPAGSTPWHVVSSVFVRSETPTEARATSFYTFHVIEPGGPPVARSAGHYDDAFALEDGAWRIRRRTVVAAGGNSPGGR